MSSFRVSDWLIVAGGVVMLILGQFLDWATLEWLGGGNGPFDYFFTGGLAWLLTVAAGVIAFLLAANVIKRETAPWPLILLAATGVATLLMLIRLILGGGAVVGIDLDRGPGMYVAFIAAAVALAGSVMKFTETGGNLRDLTDPDRLRGAFDRPDRRPPEPPGGAAPPPPPPPTGGGTPPPPPPA